VTKNEACGLLTTDTEGRILEANPTLASYVGCDVSTLIGKPLISLFPPGGRILFQTQVLPLLDFRHRLEEFYITLQRTDGSEMPVLMNAVSPTCDSASAMHWATIPIRRRDLLETELINAKVKAQEALLAKEEAARAAEAANRAKTAFLANMSHEIRTPMNAVIGMATLMLDTPLTTEQRGYIDTIRTSGDHLLNVINDILDFSKIEAGRLELEQEPFGLRECFESALDLVSARASQKNLELLLVIEEKVPQQVVGDMSRVRQIIVNLVDNAIKFTEHGEVVVAVASRSDKSGLRVSVRDTGIGIAPDRQGRLFQAFSQADVSTTRRYGGTGLGLVICKRLVELMGGSLQVHSELGQGSTFTFELALPVVTDESATAAASVPASLAGRRVLVVDDNAIHRRILERMLQSWRLQPRMVASGTEALQAFQNGGHFDVALLDYRMPEMNGVELAAAIRDLPTGRTLPLVLLGSATTHSLDSHFADSLTKPIKASHLLNTLTKVLRLPGHPAIRASTDSPPAATVPPLKVLVAEDNPVNQQVARLLLAKLGYTADVVTNGREALEALEHVAYDVVLMDVEMPEMDGLDATRALTARWTAPRRPYVIGLTAHAMAEARQACNEAGMRDYLAKPVALEQLRAALRRAWDARRTEASQAEARKPV
jgi:PAS domain S-box-containing protein